MGTSERELHCHRRRFSVGSRCCLRVGLLRLYFPMVFINQSQGFSSNSGGQWMAMLGTKACLTPDN